MALPRYREAESFTNALKLTQGTIMSFNIGLSGLRAANKRLEVTGNNIANAGTVGFKSSRADFADVYSSTRLGSGSNATGNGVRLANVSQNFRQGGMNSGTGNVLDMGIQGQGFFVLSENGAMTYTRAGAFTTDANNYITNGDRTARLQGYSLDANGRIQNGKLTDLQIDTSNLPPKASSSVSSTINMNATAPVINQTDHPFDPTKLDTYSHSYTSPIFDSQGNQHSVDQYMVKTGANTWASYTLVDGRNPDGSVFDPASQSPLTFTFSTDGKLASITPPNPPGYSPVDVSGTTITLRATGAGAWVPGKVSDGKWTPNGAAAHTEGVAINMVKTTQYSADYTRVDIIQNGNAAGQIANITIDETGMVFANYTNYLSKPIGQVALASFTNDQGLTPVGNTSWRETRASGSPSYDTPLTGTLGSVESGSLEESNVELGDELVELVRAQSFYQANAKTISTESTIMQTLFQMT